MKIRVTVQAHGDRDGVANILIMVIDGRSTHKQETLQQASELHRTNVEVFVLGVGPSADMDQEELQAIASGPQNVFIIRSFNALSTVQEIMKRKVCAVM